MSEFAAGRFDLGDQIVGRAEYEEYSAAEAVALAMLGSAACDDCGVEHDGPCVS